MIRTVIRCPNNMVMVFDRRGKQIPAYQSQYQKVKESILRDAPPDAVFAHGFTPAGKPREISSEEW